MPKLDFQPPSTSKASEGEDSSWGKFRKYGLPSEEEVGRWVKGSMPGSGAFALKVDELVERILGARDELQGARATEVEERVKDVVKRCAKVDKDGYLSWP